MVANVRGPGCRCYVATTGLACRAETVYRSRRNHVVFVHVIAPRLHAQSNPHIVNSPQFHGKRSGNFFCGARKNGRDVEGGWGHRLGVWLARFSRLPPPCRPAFD